MILIYTSNPHIVQTDTGSRFGSWQKQLKLETRHCTVQHGVVLNAERVASVSVESIMALNVKNVTTLFQPSHWSLSSLKKDKEKEKNDSLV